MYKKVGRYGCENYRGIALGNAAYKILANIILEKIKPYIEKNYQRLSEWIQRWKSCNWQHTCIKNNKRENLGV